MFRLDGFRVFVRSFSVGVKVYETFKFVVEFFWGRVFLFL